jgi:transcriptional regulator with XRE-family HTH domain
MKLSEYIKSLNMTDKAFAEEMGVTPVTISRAKSGDMGRVMAQKIIDHSGGKLTYGELYNET